MTLDPRKQRAKELRKILLSKRTDEERLAMLVAKGNGDCNEARKLRARIAEKGSWRSPPWPLL